MTFLFFRLVLMMLIGTGFMYERLAKRLPLFSSFGCCTFSFVSVNSAFAANPTGGVALKSLSQEYP